MSGTKEEEDMPVVMMIDIILPTFWVGTEVAIRM